MWHLNCLTKEQEKEYLNLIFDKVKEKRNEYSNENDLSNDVLEQYLISKPIDLYVWPNRLEKIDKEKLKKIFDYDNIISGDKAYEIADLIGVNTCVYCNRQYAFTVRNEDKNVVRPDFDHYLRQGKFPFFALSLYNLIPSCLICNRTFKGTKELDPKMNPYLTNGKKDYFKFTYHIGKNGLPASVQINDKDEKAKELLKTFKIQEIYNYHTNLELKELYEFATKYSNTYLQDVLSEMGLNLRLSQEEAYRILFGTELLKEKDNNRPLSKFKRDILRELGVIQ